MSAAPALAMWNDEEDNNPYGTSFGDRRDSITSSSANPTSPTSHDCKHQRDAPQSKLELCQARSAWKEIGG